MMKKILVIGLSLMILSMGIILATGEIESQKPVPEVKPVPEKLVALGHNVHRLVSTEGPGGNVVKDWLDKSGVKQVEWITLGLDTLQDKLFREASLPKGSVDVGFILNTMLIPEIVNLFEPLDEYLKRLPIEDFEDIFGNLRDIATIDGKIYAIPYRQAVNTLLYNEAMYREAGINEPPKYIEDLLDNIPKLTKISGSESTYGFVAVGTRLVNHATVLARAWDGDFINSDMECVANEYGMVKAITTLRGLYEAGLYPTAFPSLANTDVDNWMLQGRTAMTINTPGKQVFYNNPNQSKFAGSIKVANFPVSREFAAKYDSCPVTVEIWSMGIPKNSQNKDAAWDLIVALSSKDGTLRAALNGNGPVRSSTFTSAEFQKKNIYWEIEQEALKLARIPVPAFSHAAQAEDIFNSYAQRAILGNMTPQAAMDKVAEEVNKLLKM